MRLGIGSSILIALVCATTPLHGQDRGGWYAELERMRVGQRDQARQVAKPRPGARARATRVGETEPNNTAATATPVTLGGQGTGLITPAGDLDFWAIPLSAGTTIDVDVTALAAGSQLDSELYLFAPDGVTILAYSDDYFGPDSRLVYTVGVSGTYYISIADFFGTGGTTHTYTMDFRVAACGTIGTEQEPNDAPPTARAVTLGQNRSGVICPAGDEDWFTFTATAGQVLDLDIDAAESGSGLDPTIELFAGDGTTSLAFNDDASGLDSHLEFVAPTTGTYYLAVRDYSADGGPTFEYTMKFGVLAPGPGDPITIRMSSLGSPLGIAVQANGNILVSDPSSSTIWRIGATGGPVPFSTAVSSPTALAIDLFGRVLAMGSGTVYALSNSGASTPLIPGSDAFWLAVGPDGSIWLTEPVAYLVRRFSALGQPVASYNVAALGGFGPGPIAVGPGGQAYFSVGDRIYRLDGSGNPVLVVAHEFVMWGFTFDAQGNIYVPNPATSRISRFGPTGAVLADPFALGPVDPRAVAFGRGASGAMNSRLFATDIATGNLVEMNPAGVPVAGLPIGGSFAVTAAVAAQDLLAGGVLTASDRLILDALGNMNGRFDIGDFRAYVLSAPAPSPRTGTEARP